MNQFKYVVYYCGCWLFILDVENNKKLGRIAFRVGKRLTSKFIFTKLIENAGVLSFRTEYNLNNTLDNEQMMSVIKIKEGRKIIHLYGIY